MYSAFWSTNPSTFRFSEIKLGLKWSWCQQPMVELKAGLSASQCLVFWIVKLIWISNHECHTEIVSPTNSTTHRCLTYPAWNSRTTLPKGNWFRTHPATSSTPTYPKRERIHTNPTRTSWTTDSNVHWVGTTPTWNASRLWYLHFALPRACRGIIGNKNACGH